MGNTRQGYSSHKLQRHHGYALQRHSSCTVHNVEAQPQHIAKAQLRIAKAGQQVSPKTAASWCSWTPGRVSCMHSVIAAAVAEADSCISWASALDFSHLHGMQVYHEYHAARPHARSCRTLQEQQQRRLRVPARLGKCYKARATTLFGSRPRPCDQQ